MMDDRGDAYKSEMTIREECAKAAMQGILANRGLIDQLDPASVKWAAKRAILSADALLSAMIEREQKRLAQVEAEAKEGEA